MILKWTPTKFHRGNPAHLLDSDSAIELIESLKIKYGINTELGFKTPGFKYFKFLRSEDFESLRRYPHLVTANYGLNPLWLLWLTTINGINYNLYINLVTKQVIWSRHRFAPQLYRGTILEGEMINDTFLIWDILVNQNKPVSNKNHNLNKRIDIIRTILSHQYNSDPIIENINLQLRDYVPYQNMKSYITQIMNDPNSTIKLKPKGLFLVPIGRSMKTFTVVFNGNHQINSFRNSQLDPHLDYDPTPISIHPMIHPNPDDPTTNVQEFWLQPVEKSNDNYWQYFEEDGQLHRLGLVITTTLERSLQVKEIFATHPTHTRLGYRNLLPFKCQYIKKFLKWEPFELINLPVESSQ